MQIFKNENKSGISKLGTCRFILDSTFMNRYKQNTRYELTLELRMEQISKQGLKFKHSLEFLGPSKIISEDKNILNIRGTHLTAASGA